MCNKFITRTLQITTLNGFTTSIGEDKKPKIETVSMKVIGNPDNKKALRLMRKEFGENVVLADCVTEEKKCTVKLSDFLELAEKTENSMSAEEKAVAENEEN